MGKDFQISKYLTKVNLHYSYGLLNEDLAFLYNFYFGSSSDQTLGPDFYCYFNLRNDDPYVTIMVPCLFEVKISYLIVKCSIGMGIRT